MTTEILAKGREMLYSLQWPPVCLQIMIQNPIIEDRLIRWINTFGPAGYDGLPWLLKYEAENAA